MRIEELKTPCYVIDEKQLKKNLSILQKVEKDTGCKILLAQKAFSCFYEYPLIGQYLSGTTASGLFEARLGKEEMGKENHVFAPAYKEEILPGEAVTFAPANMNRQRAASVGTLGMQYYKEGKIETAMEHEPDYLRVSQAERERKERLGNV